MINPAFGQGRRSERPHISPLSIKTMPTKNQLQIKYQISSPKLSDKKLPLLNIQRKEKHLLESKFFSRDGSIDSKELPLNSIILSPKSPKDLLISKKISSKQSDMLSCTKIPTTLTEQDYFESELGFKGLKDFNAIGEKLKETLKVVSYRSSAINQNDSKRISILNLVSTREDAKKTEKSGRTPTFIRT
jgi:hypothetical protein